MAPRRAPWLLCGFVALASGLACNNSTPTEPASKFVSLVANVSAAGPAGTLTVSNNTCPCLSEPLAVSIDGVFAGSVACGAEQQFQVNAQNFTVEITAKGFAIQVSAQNSTVEITGRGFAMHLMQAVGDTSTNSGVHLAIQCANQ